MIKSLFFLLVLVLIALANQKISSKAEFGKEHFEAPVGDVVITRNGMNETISVCTYSDYIGDGEPRTGCAYYSGCYSCSSYCANIGYPQYCCDGTWCCCYSTQGSCSRNANCYSNYC